MTEQHPYDAATTPRPSSSSNPPPPQRPVLSSLRPSATTITPTSSTTPASPILTTPTTSRTTISTSKPLPSLPSAFGPPKAGGISRKKPLGLDISKSIPKPSSRSASLITTGPDSAGSKDSVSWVPEADRLRDEIARLQLSSRSSSSSFNSSPNSPATTSPVQATGPPPRPARRLFTADTAAAAAPAAPAPLTGATGAAATASAPAPPSTRSTPSSSTPSSARKKATANGKRRKEQSDNADTVKDEDLEVLQDLGSGNGGTVTKVWNRRRKCVMARKLILVDAKPSVRKQILRELQIMNDCSSPHIVDYYGCFPVDVHVGIVMEYMDLGSLDFIYRQTGAVPIDVVGKVAEAVLRGLVYLYDVHRIIHRDIKPSNVLASSEGDIKICDFGVSGELINSIANTFVGTSTYMSPERIQGAPYTIKSDVWSLGISLVELAQGRFPFSDSPDSDNEGNEGPGDRTFNPDQTLPISSQRPELSPKGHRKRGVSLGGGGMTMSILDLLQHIVNEPAPRLNSHGRDTFPKCAEEFVDACLDKEPLKRKSPQELLQSEWITGSKVTKEQLREWAQGIKEMLGDI